MLGGDQCGGLRVVVAPAERPDHISGRAPIVFDQAPVILAERPSELSARWFDGARICKTLLASFDGKQLMGGMFF